MERFRGSEYFRQRLLMSLLSGRPILIDEIRCGDDHSVGLREHELCLLRLVDRVTNGTRVCINVSGTSVRLYPGTLVGVSEFEHECTGERPIGYFVEFMLALCPFTKHGVKMRFRGSVCMSEREGCGDVSVDRLSRAVVPLLNKFIINQDESSVRVRVVSRHIGMDGLVELECGSVPGSLNPVQIIDPGLVKRIRGLSVGAGGISTSILTDMVHCTKQTFLNFIPDVYVTIDRKRSKSAMFGLFLVAETVSGTIYVGEAYHHLIPGEDRLVTGTEIAEQAVRELLLAIYAGGTVDRSAQWLVALYAALNAPHVSRINFGRQGISGSCVNVMRLIRRFFGGLEFRFNYEPSKMVQDAKELVVCCVGANYSNVARAMV